MKIQSVLGLCLSGSLLLAGQAALADNDKEKSNNRSARAVQVQIDKDTGRKVAEDDSSAAAASSASAVQTTTLSDSQLDRLMPEKTEEISTRADGIKEIRLSQDSLQFFTVTIDESGNKKFSHQPTEELSATSTKLESEKGLK